jgi:predicted HicB family RNase H-like nuclease
MSESDEVAAHQWRLAQSNRFLRFCKAQGVDPEAVLSGTTPLDLSPISGEDGKIVPERIDIDAARADSPTA